MESKLKSKKVKKGTDSFKPHIEYEYAKKLYPDIYDDIIKGLGG